MMHDALYWRAFRFWFMGTMAFYNLTILPVVMLSYLETMGSDFLATTLFGVCVMSAGALVATYVVVGESVSALSGYHRQLEMHLFAERGRRMMLYSNPVGLAFLLARLCWRRVLIPFGEWSFSWCIILLVVLLPEPDDE